MSTPSKTTSFLLLASAFRANFEDATVRFMLSLVDDVTDAEFEKACRRAGRVSKFMPTVADLRDLVMEDRAESPPTPTPKKKMTRDAWWAICVQQDKDEMGLDDEQYEEFKAKWKAENGEDWAPPGWNPDVWNEDGSRKELVDADAAV